MNSITPLRRQGMESDIEIAFCCEGHATGRLGSVLFSTTSVTPPLDAYDAADALSERILREQPDGFCQLIIAKHGLAMPTSERRARISQSTRRFDGKVLAIAMVFEGGPMWVSSMRMVANTMMMVIPSRCPRRMFGDVPHAVAWLAENFPEKVGQHEDRLKKLGELLNGCPGRCGCARSRSLKVL